MAAIAEVLVEITRLLEEPDHAARCVRAARLVATATGAVFGAAVIPESGRLRLTLAGPSEAATAPVAALVQGWLDRSPDLAAALAQRGGGQPAQAAAPGLSSLLAGLAPHGVASLAAAPLAGSPPGGLLLALLGPAGEYDDRTPQETLEALADLCRGLLSGHDAPERSWERAALEALPDALEVYDGQGRLLHVNARHRALFGSDAVRPGMTQPEVLERLGVVVPHTDGVERRADHGQAGVLELAAPGPEPAALERVSAAVPSNAAGTGAVALYRDVSRLRRQEKQKDEFLSHAAHELRTPLTTIKGYSQMLQRRLRNAASAGADGAGLNLDRAALEADQIREEGDRLNRRVDQLLDVSRIHTGRLRLSRKVVDLRVLLPEAIERLRVALDGREVTYAAPRERLPLLADADDERVRQILGNLIENAARYSPPDAVIEVRLRQAAPAGGGPRRAVISVRDHGLGIERADLDRIFDQFYRAPRPAALQPLGLGLGLFISREIVQQHGGRIWAESAGQGKGSTFLVELPLVDPPPP